MGGIAANAVKEYTQKAFPNFGRPQQQQQQEQPVSNHEEVYNLEQIENASGPYRQREEFNNNA